MERKLTAILCAGVYGYSRLMRRDEPGTFATLRAYRKIIDSLIEQHYGRFVNSAGDSVLAEFASVVNAVQCAIDVQTALKAENAKMPAERQMEFRIGVNLGDVMVEGAEIYGDGVNIAARLESLAEPGGICISDTVHAQIRIKLALSYQDLGAQPVKNIAEPVRVFRVITEPVAEQNRVRQVARKHWRAGTLSFVGLAIVAVTIVVVQHVSLRPPRSSASIPPQQRPAQPLPDIPSIAVLPFANFSNDPQQEYFSDGLTEDLITDLSKVPGLFVVARNSVFTYKNKPERVEQIGRELGVRYLLEGSARKADNQVRITAQLVDSSNGYHVWADHYDKPLSNIFTVQDQIREKIVFALKVKLSPEEQKRFKYIGTNNMDAYDLFLRTSGKKWFTKEGNREVRHLCEQALALDPNYSAAAWCISTSYFSEAALGLDTDPDVLRRALVTAQQAVSLDDSSALAHSALGDAYKGTGKLEEAIREARKSVELGPSCPQCYGELAEHLMCAARPADALPLLEKALRLDPVDYRVDYKLDIAAVHLKLGKRNEGLSELEQVVIREPAFGPARGILAVVYADEHREKEARAEAAEWQKLVSPLTIAKIREVVKQNDVCKDQTDQQHGLDTLERLTSGVTPGH